MRPLVSKYIHFSRAYFAWAVILFITEVLIAIYLKHGFIRAYVGDVLVVILIYCFIKAFFRLPVLPVAIGVLLFAFTIETLQYFNIVDKIGLSHSRLAVIVIGNSFSWGDMLTYIIGIVIVLLAEKIKG